MAQHTQILILPLLSFPWPLASCRFPSPLASCRLLTTAKARTVRVCTPKVPWHCPAFVQSIWCQSNVADALTSPVMYTHPPPHTDPCIPLPLIAAIRYPTISPWMSFQSMLTHGTSVLFHNTVCYCNTNSLHCCTTIPWCSVLHLSQRPIAALPSHWHLPAIHNAMKPEHAHHQCTPAKPMRTVLQERGMELMCDALFSRQCTNQHPNFPPNNTKCTILPFLSVTPSHAVSCACVRWSTSTPSGHTSLGVPYSHTLATSCQTSVGQ